MNSQSLLLFIPTFFAVSATPGLCMTLAMTLGMTIGIKKSLWMMFGELLGVTIVAFTSLMGVSSMLLAKPTIFLLFKIIGGVYLAYLGIKMIQNKSTNLGPMQNISNLSFTKQTLLIQGFMTAIANPKGWAFMIALLPPFINISNPVLPQAMILISIILFFEFFCMMVYCSGGKGLRKLLQQNNNLHLMNKISGSLLILIAICFMIEI